MDPLKLMCGKHLRELRRREQTEGRQSSQANLTGEYPEILG